MSKEAEDNFRELIDAITDYWPGDVPGELEDGLECLRITLDHLPEVDEGELKTIRKAALKDIKECLQDYDYPMDVSIMFNFHVKMFNVPEDMKDEVRDAIDDLNNISSIGENFGYVTGDVITKEDTAKYYPQFAKKEKK